jgi:tetratricopeptide (TPR) repeat protein
VTFAGLLLGTVAVAGHGAAPTPAGSQAAASPRESPRRLRRAGFALVAVAAIALQLPTLVAASNLRASQQESARNDLVGAVADAGAAVRAQPWAASAYLQLGLSLEAADELGPAADAVEKATRHEPLNWQSWLILGRIRAERGQIQRALVALATARRLNPRSPLFNPGVAHRLAG